MVIQIQKFARNAKLAGMILALTSSSLAHAIGVVSTYEQRNYGKDLGYIGFDSSSFFYKSSARGTAATTLEASIHGKFENGTFEGNADLLANSFVTDKPQAVVESHEAYISTKSGVLPADVKVSVGRKYYEWSKLDQPWNMMSVWSPRYTWDQLHPESIGMTGVFVEHETQNLKLAFFASPLAVPERGTPIEEKDNNIVSPNPFWKPLPTTLNIMNNPTSVKYSLLMPSMSQILLRPNFAIHGRYDFDNGMWVSLNTGVLPVHMVQMAAETFVQGDINVNIRPQLPMRNINTAEVGYDSPDKDWNVWLSASYEQPFQFENQKTWLNPIITPTSIFSAGTQVQLTSNFWFNGAALFLHEQPFTRASSLPDVKVDLPSRFPLKQGFKVGGNWRFNDYTQSDISWLQDLVEQNHMVSLDIRHQFRNSSVSIGGGTDVIIAKSAQGFMGQYYGDDRLRGWLKYAF